MCAISSAKISFSEIKGSDNFLDKIIGTSADTSANSEDKTRKASGKSTEENDDENELEEEEESEESDDDEDSDSEIEKMEKRIARIKEKLLKKQAREMGTSSACQIVCGSLQDLCYSKEAITLHALLVDVFSLLHFGFSL